MFSVFLLAFLSLVHRLHSQEQNTVIEAPEDMACMKGLHAEQWGIVKHRFRTLFNETDSFVAPKMDAVVKAVESSVAEIEAVGGWKTEAAAECGFGKLFLQLLTISRVDEPAVLAQYLQEHPTISSPVLTLLLDIPWVLTAQTGWPMFAILRQLNQQKVDVVGPMLRYEEVDGLEDVTAKKYFDRITEAQGKSDMPAAMHASADFLNDKTPANAASPFAMMTALATQAAVQMNVKERLDLLKLLQDSFKQTVTSPAELDIALTTRWPLWSYLHVGVDVFYDM